MTPFADRAAVAWYLFFRGDLVEWRATSSTEALASRCFGTALGTTVCEWLAAIFAELFIGGVFAPAIRAPHIRHRPKAHLNGLFVAPNVTTAVPAGKGASALLQAFKKTARSNPHVDTPSAANQDVNLPIGVILPLKGSPPWGKFIYQMI
jgi:hypothetical protein